MARARATAAALAAAVALVLAAALPAGATASTASEAKAALARLATDVRHLPAGDAKARRALLGLASRARRQRRSPCRALSTLRSFDKRLRRLKRRAPKAQKSAKRARPVATRGTLEADAVAAEAALLADPKARGCGGARRAAASSVTREVLKSDTSGMTVRVTLPQAHFAARRLGGRDWSQMAMDDMSQGSDVGDPGVPTRSEQFGVPTGAGVSVRARSITGYTLRGVNLLPEQAPPVDQSRPNGPPSPTDTAFFDKPFQIDAKAYRSNRAFPAQPTGESSPGMMRDVRIGGATVAGGQYRPRSRSLRVITSVVLDVRFTGDNAKTFGDARLTDPFNATFDRLYRATLLNDDVVMAHPGVSVTPDFCGEEVLIVTSSALRPAANTLQTQKQTEGFVTRIVETGSGPGQIGTTPEAIQGYIRGQLTGRCWIRPSYVVIIGNTEQVPTFIVPCGPGGDPAQCNIASDLPYELQDGGDYLADVSLGRIAAPDLATATTEVDKIVNYEAAPPAPLGSDFYHRFTVTSYFEPTYLCDLNPGASGTPNCDPAAGPVNASWVYHPEITQDARGFTKTSERVRNAMLARGYTVDRLYYADPATDPQTYYDGTPMPAAIRKPGFPWNATTEQFVGAFNSGRSIIFHRDHGGAAGWSAPGIGLDQIPQLTNGTQLPVAFGINCASATFDDPGFPSFVERLVQKDGGGAVGAFGDSRNSNTWANNNISLGFFDALFPNLLPSYGADDPLQRMGDVLLAGKQYLVTADPGSVYGHGHLYGYFGDPTMQLWIDPPRTFDPSKIKAEIRRDTPPFKKPPGPGPDPPPFYVLASVPEQGAEGTLVTLQEKSGNVIGRGVVRGGQAVIFPDAQPRTTAGLELRLQNQGFFGQAAPVAGQ